MAWAFDAPAYWPSEPSANSFLNDELCSVEHHDFFIRGNIEIPVHSTKECFAWGVWVSLSRNNFERAIKLWKSPKRVEEQPYFGWLSNSVPGYPETLNLKTNVHTRGVGLRPFIHLHHTDHPLSVEQHKGITEARLVEIISLVAHYNKQR
jgi:hypothetical protein